LISSQLDVDRLDYLKRDSFFTGVQEGSIGSERIIKMLNVVENELVVDPFCCTGTFLIEAAKQNRIAIGCDISQDNLNIAISRGCIKIGK